MAADIAAPCLQAKPLVVVVAPQAKIAGVDQYEMSCAGERSGGTPIGR